MNNFFEISMAGVDTNLLDLLLSSYNNTKRDQSKRYMTLHRFNIFLSAQGLKYPTFEFFDELSKFKDKIYFEFRMDINNPQYNLITLIYDEPINRMGIKIKKEIMTILLANNFNGKQDFYNSKIYSKSYFYL